MENVKHSQAFLRKRKMLLVLPLLIIPFCTMAFWALGGGKGSKDSQNLAEKKGLNLQLPNANLKDEPLDKMSFYEKADKDSIKMTELLRNDPYFNQKDSATQPYTSELEQIAQQSAGKYNQLIASPYQSGSSDMIEQKVLGRLEKLQTEISKPKAEPDLRERSELTVNNQKGDFSSDIDRLENMFQLMKQSPETDPEMRQIENTMDKILDIQHPDRIKERLKKQSVRQKQKVFPISSVSPSSGISLFGKVDTSKKGIENNGFYGSGNETPQIEQNAVEAMVHEAQALVNGSIVKLRLLNDIYINGTLIAKDNFLFGVANLNGERLIIEINSIRHNQSLFPVKLAVYDLDGLEGIYIPGAITRDVAKQSVDNGLQSVELATLSPSIGAQTAATGINAAKSLISKKAKLVKVTVKSGYKVLLKDANNEQ